MSTRRRGRWEPKGTGPTGRPLCYCGCGREVPKPSRTKFEPACWERWAARNDPATQRRLVYVRDKGVCALCGVNTEHKAREAEETARLVRWLARRHADDLHTRGELPVFPGFSPSAKRYAAYIQEHEKPARPTHHDAYLWAEHWAEEEMRRRFGETRVSGSGHTWEADHIVPVVEGGGECDLSNLRTLCLRCHRAETAKLAKRRAERRKQEKAASA